MTTTVSTHPERHSIHAIATFTASRRELFGSDPLVGPAELARAVCRGAQQTMSIFAVTHRWMRRVDGWLDHHGFVTHGAAHADRDPVLGSLSNRVTAPDVLATAVHTMVGDCPDQALDAPVAHDLRALGASSMPADADWFILVVVGDGAGEPFSHGIAAMAAGARLAVADFTSIADPVEFRGASPNDWHAMLAATVRPATPSLSELLASAPSR